MLASVELRMRPTTPRAGEDVVEREHPAPRRAEQVDAVEAELLAYGHDLVARDVDRPFDVRRTVGAPASDLVVEHQGPLVRDPLERCEVVVCRAGPPVEGEQRRSLRFEVTDGAIPGAVAAKVDISLVGIAHDDPATVRPAPS